MRPIKAEITDPSNGIHPIERIDSLENKKIKRAAALQNRKEREKSGLFVAEGVRLTEMAVASDFSIRYTLVADSAQENERVKAILVSAAKRSPVYSVTDRVFAKAAGTEHSQGVLCVLEQRKQTLESLPEEENPLYLVLDRLQDPGNLGTILRTADAANVSGVILLKGTVDCYSPKVVRSAMGSLFYLPVVNDIAEEELLAFAEKRGIHLMATALDDSATSYTETDLTQPAALLFGNEGQGVSDTLLKQCDSVYIPMFGKAESLNVAVSTGIVLYEAARQRHPSQFGQKKA